jgi:hypothetical protein
MPDLDQLSKAILQAASNAATCRRAGDEHGEREANETVEALNLLILRAMSRPAQ